MSVIAKWATPGAKSADIASTYLNSLANGSTSSGMAYDNSSNLDLYAAMEIDLGSVSPSAGGSLLVTVYNNPNGSLEDFGGGVDTYVVPLKTGSSAKVAVIPMIRLYPWAMQFTIQNNSGVTMASSGNHVYITPYDEQVG